MLNKLLFWELRIPELVFLNRLSQHISHKIEQYLIGLAAFAGLIGTYVSFTHGWILAYGDAESHINIAKKVVSSLTPGFAQLGGIWLPVSHLMMLPFVLIDPLWRTGLAGSIVSGVLFVISCIYLYKTVYILTTNKLASFITFLVYAANFNVLYMQSTPMTEIPLIAFFVLSTYFFIKYLLDEDKLVSVMLAALFAFLASLTRYDGWFLVIFESIAIVLPTLFKKGERSKVFGILYLYLTLAGFGIICWFIWDWLILGDPLYFTNSIYSAKAQQMAWMAKGELPAYHNLFLSLVYYTYTSITNVGLVIFIAAFLGVIVFLSDRKIMKKWLILLILMVPFIFNIASLVLGQDVIFIPGLTPANFEWKLFNVRYGIQMVPTAAVFFGYLFSKFKFKGQIIMGTLFILQIFLLLFGFSHVITLEDGTSGLSASKVPVDVENFINKNYDGGLVLIDDYARTISITRSTIPMQNVIYVGNRPYWQESLKQPEKYARWIIMQKDDAVWSSVYANPTVRGNLYKYFKKVYTSNVILIFERNSLAMADALH